jgi:hypothetical protein
MITKINLTLQLLQIKTITMISRIQQKVIVLIKMNTKLRKLFMCPNMFFFIYIIVT